MSDGVDLTSHQVVQPIGSRGVDEAIPDPFPSLNNVGNISLELESLFNSLVVQLSSVVDVSGVGIPIESENVERVFSRDGDEVPSS